MYRRAWCVELLACPGFLKRCLRGRERGGSGQLPPWRACPQCTSDQLLAAQQCHQSQRAPPFIKPDFIPPPPKSSRITTTTTTEAIAWPPYHDPEPPPRSCLICFGLDNGSQPTAPIQGSLGNCFARGRLRRRRQDRNQLQKSVA